MNLKDLKDLGLSLSRVSKTFLMMVSDYVFILFSAIIILILNSENILELDLNYLFKLILGPLLCIFILLLLGAYRSLVRFINFSNIVELARSLIILSILDGVICISFFDSLFYGSATPLKDFALNWFLVLLLLTGMRLIANSFFSEQISSSRVLIYGAGSAGIQLASALRISSEMHPVAFIDSDQTLHNSVVGGLKVLSPEKLDKVIKNKGIDEILIAIPSLRRQRIKEILKKLENYSIKTRVLPGVAELAQGKVSVSELKEIQVEDLLGREKVQPDQSLLDKNIKDKVVLITGAGGSIGSEIARQVCLNGPSQLILLDSSEFALYSIDEELKTSFEDINIKSAIGNVTDKKRVKSICTSFKVDTIYHTAAYKHVPLVEKSPFEGVSNNVFGTLNTVISAIESKVDSFTLISTDKAVRPTNIMGATKRFSELVIQSIANNELLRGSTETTIVRFGNVLGSSGSAVPLFNQQIKNGGPVTVTDPEVIRYFMTIPEASELVIQAGAMGGRGEIFVLDMGEPVKILDLARRMIKLSGMEIRDEENPDGDIEIVFTGLRPGEKLYEELLIEGNVSDTNHSQILKAEEDYFVWEDMEGFINELKKIEENNDLEGLIKLFMKIVSGYKPNEEIQDVIFQNK